MFFKTNTLHDAFIADLKKQTKKSLHNSSKPNPTPFESNIITTIQAQTKQRNTNNITRTQAYLDFYRNHPEVHWALLAHLVSRNAGWSMTDLKGEFLSRLLTEQEHLDFFLFLERGNWLIFQDAFPQLLLYEESKKRNKSLFHLLPSFHVSTFMEAFWRHFWDHKSSDILTNALIINEQHYIEERVLQHKPYENAVLDTIIFKLQEWFNLNHILFPYTVSTNSRAKLIGDTVHHFAKVDERISLGKRLYVMLFSIQSRLNQVINWASTHPHSGSRQDFWPHLFNQVKETMPGRLYHSPVNGCERLPDHPRIYSPCLDTAWKNVQQPEAEPGDWFNTMKAFDFISKHSTTNDDGNMQKNYCETIEKLELAVSTQKSWLKRDT